MLSILYRIVFFIGLLLHGILCSAQINNIDSPDSAKATTVYVAPSNAIVADSIPLPFQPDPKRAGLYSAIVPGLGQFYNRQYWKVPVIYAGLAVAGYFFVDNLTNYQSFRKAYVSRINNPYWTDKYVNIYTSDQLLQLQNEYNKFLNLTVLFTGIGYTLQIVEAITGAHLKNFDISRDISMQMRPVAMPAGAGIGLVLTLK